MNHKRAKALRRQFRKIHGYDPKAAQFDINQNVVEPDEFRRFKKNWKGTGKDNLGFYAS